MPVPKKIIAAGACLACVAVVWGYQTVRDAGWFSSARTVTAPPKSTPPGSIPPKSIPAAPKSESSLPSTMQAPSEPVFSSSNSETLGDLTKIRCEVEMMKERVKLEELKARLQELKEPRTSEMPSMSTPAMSPELMAALTPPPTLQALPSPSADVSPSFPGAYRLLGIQSCGDAVSASVQTPEGGERIVTVGDRLGSARVKAISSDGVRLSSGKTLGW